jgi:hypothetical protein
MNGLRNDRLRAEKRKKKKQRHSVRTETDAAASFLRIRDGDIESAEIVRDRFFFDGAVRFGSMVRNIAITDCLR